MSEPFLGEIRLFGFNFAPRGWAACDGQILPINQNQSLYSLLGTNYGGDGRTTFGLPDLRGRSPMHSSVGFSLGKKGGEQAHILRTNEIPAHQHQLSSASGSSGVVGALRGSANAADTTEVSNHAFASDPADSRLEDVGYSDAVPDTRMADMIVELTGKTAGEGDEIAHDNLPPYLGINFCIALQGLFPSRS